MLRPWYWGWGTVPAVAAVAFALLGIEGASTARAYTRPLFSST